MYKEPNTTTITQTHETSFKQVFDVLPAQYQSTVRKLLVGENKLWKSRVTFWSKCRGDVVLTLPESCAVQKAFQLIGVPVKWNNGNLTLKSKNYDYKNIKC